MTPGLETGQITSDPKAVIAVYNTHPEAETAVKELQRGGFDMKKLSVDVLEESYSCSHWGINE